MASQDPSEEPLQALEGSSSLLPSLSAHDRPGNTEAFGRSLHLHLGVNEEDSGGGGGLVGVKGMEGGGGGCRAER